MSTYGRQVQLQELWWALQGCGPWSASGPMLGGGSTRGQSLCFPPLQEGLETEWVHYTPQGTISWHLDFQECLAIGNISYDSWEFHS